MLLSTQSVCWLLDDHGDISDFLLTFGKKLLKTLWLMEDILKKMAA